MTTGISLIVPAWNEEKRIGASLTMYLSALKSIGTPFEVLVVIDGVGDRTGEIARSFAADHVEVLEFPTQLGKGGAVVAGVAAAQYDIVGYLDADSPITREDIHQLVSSIPSADATIGSRRLRESKVTGKVPLSRRVFRVLFNALTRSVLGLPFRDTQCGAKFFRAAAIRPILPRIKLRGWAFDAAILYAIRKSGGTIREIPVTWNYDDDSKLPLAEQVPVMFLSVFFIRIVNLSIIDRLPERLKWWFASNFMRRTVMSNQIIQAALFGSGA